VVTAAGEAAEGRVTGVYRCLGMGSGAALLLYRRLHRGGGFKAGMASSQPQPLVTRALWRMKMKRAA